MKYYVLLLIQAPNTEHFIEVGFDYELHFHPNLTDQLEVAGFPCEIREIYYNLDELNHVKMRVEAVDGLLSMLDNPSSKYIHAWLSNKWRQIKDWTTENNETAILTDCSHHPEKPFGEL